jgi:hypothetical protein
VRWAIVGGFGKMHLQSVGNEAISIFLNPSFCGTKNIKHQFSIPAKSDLSNPTIG